MARSTSEDSRLRTLFKTLSKQKMLMLMSLPFLIWVIIFKYLPLWGWTIAFQKFRLARDLFDQTWIGLDNFRSLFKEQQFYLVLRNTLVMSSINLVLGFVTAIVLALLLNELRKVYFKRAVQTISYLPHFISWVVAANIVQTALAPEGIVNVLLLRMQLIDHPILWLGIGEYFWGILGVTEVWKNVGWNTIIYLAAITTIDPTQYEAAEMDGASRLQRMWHVTLPGMKPVIIILLIMNLGHILESGFEAQYLLGNGINVEFSENLDIFVLKYGMQMNNFGLATAAGMFKTVVSFIFLIAANNLAKRMGESRLY
ncbi:ABC transporter permease [Bacillus sp. FJAT-28004]|uniref:ABC transporter permease n=1 Tax=Bacillus sp. FJAT-28004 TaxID=1679165 RepID=UPI0006B62E53|nr:ABC transporter permease subunit [Bacillus sp. FJAT-28004]